MKTKIWLGCALAFTLAASSCSDFLDEDPKGKLTPSTYFSTQDELNMSVYSLYRKVANTQGYTNMQLPQWMGDDITANPGSNKQAAAEFDAFAPADNNKGVLECWSQHYSLIKAANYIILNADRTPTTDEEKNIAIGQAKYWRAYAYFTLVRVFGPLPMNLTNEIDYTAPLASVEDVYAQIIKDLQDCESLPTNYTTAPRANYGANTYITQQAAKSTLAAVYMAMAGWPLNKTEYYAQAASKAKEVIDGVNAGTYEYILESEFKHVYAPSHNYTHETVVGINYSSSFPWEQDSQLTSSNLFESVGNGWGDGYGEIRFWKNMPEGPRKAAIYNPKILYGNKEGGKLVDWWEKDEKGINYIPEIHPMFSIFSVGVGNTDYDYTKPASEDMVNDHRHRIIRYAEVLLWYAESQARAEGTPNAMAYECVNKIRARAGLEPLKAGMNGQAFADAVVTEHGWEIAGYWCALVTRRADQFRMNTLKQTFEERAANTSVEVAPGVTVIEQVNLPNKTWNDNLMYAPYPSTDASLNPNLKR